MKLGYRGYNVGILLKGAHGRYWKGSAMISDIEPQKNNNSGIHVFSDIDVFIQSGYGDHPVVAVVDIAGHNPNVPYYDSAVVHAYRVTHARIVYLFIHKNSVKYAGWLRHHYGVPVETFDNKEDLSEKLHSLNIGDIDDFGDNIHYYEDKGSIMEKFMDNDISNKFANWISKEIADQEREYTIYYSFNDFRKRYSQEKVNADFDMLKNYPNGTIAVTDLSRDNDADNPGGRIIFVINNGQVQLINADEDKIGVFFSDDKGVSAPTFDRDMEGEVDLIKYNSKDRFSERNEYLGQLLSSSNAVSVDDFPVEFRWIFREEDDTAMEAAKDPKWYLVYLYKKHILDEMVGTNSEKTKRMGMILKKLMRDSSNRMGYEELDHYIVDEDNNTVTDERTGRTLSFKELKKELKRY